MNIGDKIKQLRLRLGLTQEELADRTELSKGFISQLERDLTSPSITTLMDILEALGTNAAAFFSERAAEKVVFGADEMFVKEDSQAGITVRFLVTSSQKNQLEPILVKLAPGGSSYLDDPHDGEEFGYLLSGSLTLFLGSRSYKLKKGDSFYFRPLDVHYVKNTGKREASVLWVSTPPSF